MDEVLHDLHLRAGRAAGRGKTCGTKTAYPSEGQAARAADAHNRWRDRRHDVEPYPCAFCGRWHIGRVMPRPILEELAAADRPGEAP